MSLRRPKYLNYLWSQRTHGEREIEGDRVKREWTGWEGERAEKREKIVRRDKNGSLSALFKPACGSTKWGTPLIMSVILYYTAVHRVNYDTCNANASQKENEKIRLIYIIQVFMEIVTNSHLACDVLLAITLLVNGIIII